MLHYFDFGFICDEKIGVDFRSKVVYELCRLNCEHYQGLIYHKMVVESGTTATLTAAYVDQLKTALLQKNEECESFKLQNLKLTQQITQLEAYITEITAEKEFHRTKASLLSTNVTTHSGTHHDGDSDNASGGAAEVVSIVSSWIPENVEGTVACCLKIGENWMIIEEDETVTVGPLSSSSDDVTSRSIGGCVSNKLLDEMVEYAGVANGKMVDTPVDSVELAGRGWSRDHNSVGLVVCPQCIWFVVSVRAAEVVGSINGLYDMLESATELVMNKVTGAVTQQDWESQFHRQESALIISRLLLAAPPASTTTRATSVTHADTSSSNGSLTNTTAKHTALHTMHIFESMPKVLALAAESSISGKVTCDVVLFVRNAKTVMISSQSSEHDLPQQPMTQQMNVTTDINPTVLSAKFGLLVNDNSTDGSVSKSKYSRQGGSHSSTSLTLSAVKERKRVLICNDVHNIARDAVIDCGHVNRQHYYAPHHQGRGHQSYDNSDLDDVSLAILPLWTEADHKDGVCYVHDALFGNDPLFAVSGAVIYRKHGAGSFTTAEERYFQRMYDDSMNGITQFLKKHLCLLLHQVVSGVVHFSSEKWLRSPQQPLSHLHHGHHMDTSLTQMTTNNMSTSFSKSYSYTGNELSVTSQQSRQLMDLFLNHGFHGIMDDHSSEVVSMLTSSFGCEWVVLLEYDEAGGGGGHTDQQTLQLIDNLGLKRTVMLPRSSIDVNPVTQSIKHCLKLCEERVSSSDENDNDCILLNYLFTDHKAGDISEMHAFISSLLNKKSSSCLSPPGVGVSDLLPVHVFCQPISLTMNDIEGGECMGQYVIIGGQLWRPFEYADISSTAREIELMFKTLENCRRKDRLYSVIAAAREEADQLKVEMARAANAEMVVVRFNRMLTCGVDDVDNQPSNICPASRMFEALKYSCSAGVFASSTKLMICAADSVTGRYWHMQDTRREGLRVSNSSDVSWSLMDPSLSDVLVDWPTENDRLSPISGNLSVQTDIGMFIQGVDGTGETRGYCLIPLHADQYSTTLSLYLLLLCPNLDPSSINLSSSINNWMTSFLAFFHSHANEFVHIGFPRIGVDQNSVTRVLGHASTTATSNVEQDLNNFNWLTNELDNNDGQPNHVSSTHWQMKPFEYLSNGDVWDSAVGECMGGNLTVLVPILEFGLGDHSVSLSGHVSPSGRCVDMLCPSDRVSAGLNDVLIKLAHAHCGDGDTDGVAHSVMSATSNNQCQTKLSVLSKPGLTSNNTRKLLQQYLQDKGKGHYSISIAGDTLLKFSITLPPEKDNNGGDSEGPFSCIHVFLSVPSELFFTSEHLSQVGTHLSALLSPISTIWAHRSLRSDLTRFVSMFYSEINGNFGNDYSLEDVDGDGFRHKSFGKNHYVTYHNKDMSVENSMTLKSPVKEIIYGHRLSNSKKFLGIIYDLFAAKSSSLPMACGSIESMGPLRGSGVGLKRSTDQSSIRHGGGYDTNDNGVDNGGCFKFELIDGTVYTDYDISNSTHSAPRNGKFSRKSLNKVITHSYFKQNGGNFKKTFSGSASLLPLPDVLMTNNVKRSDVPNLIQIDILPERQLATEGVRNDDEYDDLDESFSSNGEAAEEEENVLGSVQYIRISFFQHTPVYSNNVEGSTSSQISSKRHAHHGKHNDRDDDSCTEQVIILIRGMVTSVLAPSATRRPQLSASFQHTHVNVSNVMVSNLIPLAELNMLAVVTNQSFVQLANVAVASVSEVEHYHSRINTYQEKMKEVVDTFEHIFMQLSNPKLINVHSLMHLSTMPGVNKRATIPRKQTVVGTFTRGDAVSGTIDRELYYKSVASATGSRSGRGGGASSGVSGAVKGAGLLELIERGESLLFNDCC